MLLVICMLATILALTNGDHPSHNPFSNGPPPIGFDLRTSIDPRSSSQFSSNFDLDVLSAPAPFTTSAPRIINSGNGRSAEKKPRTLPEGVDISQAQRMPDGRLCVIKESSVETLSKDPILECTHKNVQKCHYTYVTQFSTAQEEVCQENFEKLCQITFKQQATRETVKKCYKPMRKVCNGQGPEECRTVYESSCTTRYVQKQPGNFSSNVNYQYRTPFEFRQVRRRNKL